MDCSANLSGSLHSLLKFVYAGDAVLCYDPIRTNLQERIELMKGKHSEPLERYSITIEEAAEYSLIGETRLRRIIEQDKTLKWVLRVGSQVRIKRVLFERWLDEQYNL